MAVEHHHQAALATTSEGVSPQKGFLKYGIRVRVCGPKSEPYYFSINPIIPMMAAHGLRVSAAPRRDREVCPAAPGQHHEPGLSTPPSVRAQRWRGAGMQNRAAAAAAAAAAQPEPAADPTTTVAAVFAIFDEDADGCLDSIEYRSMLTATGRWGKADRYTTPFWRETWIQICTNLCCEPAAGPVTVPPPHPRAATRFD